MSSEPSSDDENKIQKFSSILNSEELRSRSINFTLTNLFTYFAILSPFFLTFFMIMFSILNNAIVKGLLFLIGLVIVSFLVYLFKNILKEKQSEYADVLCNVLPMPFTLGSQDAYRYSSPIASTVILGYISSYLIFPMWINNDINSPLLIILVVLFLTNSVTELWKKCGTLGGIILGGIIGITFGILYYGLIVGSGNKDLAYFSEIKSNAQGCKKPSKQKFKCTTFKNGARVP